MDSVLVENENVTTAGGIIVVATIVTLEMIICLILNLFILIFTVTHFKILKNPGIIMLTNFVIANIFLALVYMLSIPVSAVGGGWIYGSSLEERYSSCQFIGFVLDSYGLNVTFTTTAISVDRFLLLVKPYFHKRYMNIWVAIAILVMSWVLSCVFSLPPLVKYEYTAYFLSCIPRWKGNMIAAVISYLPAFLCIIVIVVTTIWTLCFTMKFIQRSQQPVSSPSDDNLYNKRICKIIGMFGTLLIITITCYVPAFIFASIEILSTRSEKVLSVSDPLTISFLSLTILNPAVQLFFRKELSDFLKSSISRFRCTQHNI